MAIERIIGHSSLGPLLGGLDWRPPFNGAHSTRSLHEARSHTDSTHYAMLEAHGLTRYGLYKPRPSEALFKLPKGVLSAAACFAQLVGAQAPNAALVLPVDSSDEREEQKYLVVVLEDGVPHIDTVVTEMSARDTIGSEERPMWAFSRTKYPNCEVVNHEWLASAGSRGTKVAAIPVNPWPAVVLLGLVLIALGGFWGYQKAQKAEEMLRLAQAAAAADPTPKYFTALAMQSAQSGTDRADLVSGLQQLFQLEVVIPGWKLSGVECRATTQRCALRWARLGGTLDDIQKALPEHELVALTGGTGSEVPLLDAVVSQHRWPIQRQALSKAAPHLLGFDAAMKSAFPLFQVWSTAGLAVEVKPPALWPQVPALPPTFSHPSAVRSGQFSVGSIPAPFVQEVIESAPPWVQWERIGIELAGGSDPRRLSFNVSGNYYVSSQ